MTSAAFFWLTLTLLCLFTQAFYSMLEMGSVSFSKVRLQYYVSKGNKRALWLNKLLQNPSRLFGTTLLGVNIALQIGSECSRQFYEAIHLSPDIAPVTQVFLVLIFAELAPMFAARHYAEHVVMLGIPIIYASSCLMKPIIVSIETVSHLANKLLGRGKHVKSLLYFTREELQKVFEEHDDHHTAPKRSKDFTTIVSNIFTLRNRSAEDIMAPTYTIPMAPSTTSVSHIRTLFDKDPYFSHIPVYHRSRRNIIGIISAASLLKANDADRVETYSSPPWFVTENTPIFQILEQFKRNNQDVAVILDHDGSALGILSLDDILDEIFGEEPDVEDADIALEQKDLLVIERSFPADMTIQDFNDKFGTEFPHLEGETLADLIAHNIDHLPEQGETIRIENFEFIVEEASILGAKTVTVKSRI
jgi:putative hemolysin